MGETKRKRGRKPKSPSGESGTIAEDNKHPKNATTSTNDLVVSVPSFSAVDGADATVPESSTRRPGRPKKFKRKDKAQPHVVVGSPERRSSRLAEQNGDCAATGLVVEPPMMPNWESAVKVVPSMDAVVKVFCVHTEPNFSLPWQRKRQYSSSSSGFIVAGRRVLTNAHSVEHHTQVKLKKRGSDTKYLATVLAIGTECDIGRYLFGLS